MDTQKQYMYCTTHRKCLVDEHEANDHADITCEIILKDYSIHQRVKVNKLWVARSIVEKEGMEIHTPRPLPKQPRESTLPSNVITLDSGLPFVRLG